MLKNVLPPGSRQRAAATGVAAFLLVLLITQVLLPGRGGARGTPAAFLFSGFVKGMVTALSAAGIVLIYRSTRIINFAQVAIGAAGAFMVFQCVQLTSIPFPISLTLGIAIGAFVGLAFDLAVGRRFFNAPRLVLTVFTIAVAGFLVNTSQSVINLAPWFPRLEERTLDQLSGGADIKPLLPFPGLSFEVGGFPLKFGFAHVFAIEASIVALLLVAAFFRYTKSGVAIRAVAENNERASLLGISVGGVSSKVWMVAGALAAVGVTLNGMLATPGVAAGFSPEILLPALAAAVVGRMRSFPVTVAAAVGLGILTDAANYSLRDDVELVSVFLFLIVGVGLLVQRKSIQRSEAGATVSWQATQESRGIPKELAGLGIVRGTRITVIVIGLLILVLFPFFTTSGPTQLGGVIALNAIVALSLVVLTGWAGQVSLGQVAFAAIGSVVGGSLSGRVGIPFWFAVPLASAITGGIAFLVGIPALRIKGLFLGITTFAFAIAVRSVLFEERYFGWMLPQSSDVNRPTLFILDFESERMMYYLCVVALVLSIVVVTNLRKSRFGRMLIGVRENEANLQSFGINVVRAKLVAFTVAGALAGFAGAILAHQQRGVAASQFGPERSLFLFVYAVVGGIGSVGGAVIGSTYDRAVTYFFASNVIVAQLQAFIPLIVLYVAPGGIVALLTAMRDAALRIVAQRRQIVVPSLFADYDPDALARRLIPLAEADSGAGLAALPVDERYAMRSELYVGKGERFIDKLAPAKQTQEAAAIGAASTAVQEDSPMLPTGAPS